MDRCVCELFCELLSLALTIRTNIRLMVMKLASGNVKLNFNATVSQKKKVESFRKRAKNCFMTNTRMFCVCVRVFWYAWKKENCSAKKKNMPGNYGSATFCQPHCNILYDWINDSVVKYHNCIEIHTKQRTNKYNTIAYGDFWTEIKASLRSTYNVPLCVCVNACVCGRIREKPKEKKPERKNFYGEKLAKSIDSNALCVLHVQ